MATLDDSPSLNVGQPWSSWIADVPSSPESDSRDDNSKNDNDESCGSMKLDRKDMGLFGQCPSQDEFYLVVCNICEKVIKPKAFKRHLQLRHGDKSKHSKYHQSICSKSSVTSHKTSSFKVAHGGVPTKASVKEVPPLINSSQTRTTNFRVKHARSEKESQHNHLAPVVKMERMEVKKESAALVTNGEVSSENVTSDTIDIKNIKLQDSLPLPMSPMSPRPPTPVGNITPFSTSTVTLPVVSDAVVTLANTSVSVTTVAMVSTPTVTPIVAPSSTITLLAVSSGTTAFPTMNTNGIKGQKDGTTGIKSLSSLSSNVRLVGSSQSVPNLSSKPSNKKKNATPTSSVSATSILASPIQLEKPEKLIPCKDREFDANKHCGVIVEDTGKPCTRSLTCKTHALSLRRKVPGRRKTFDDLLKEHRAVKEALQKLKAEQKANQLAAQSVVGGNSKLGYIAGPASLTSAATSKPSHATSPAPIVSRTPSGSVSPQKLQAKTVRSNSNHLLSRSISQSSLQSPPHSGKEDFGGSPPYYSERLSDEDDDDGEAEKTDKPYMTHHPKPAAICTFGVRRHAFGNGSRNCCLFSRQSDIFRAAFMNVIEKHVNPPPPKKLCVESKLPQESQLSYNSKDPYEFTLVENSASRILCNQLSSNNSNNSTIKTAASKSKPKQSSSRSKSKDTSSSGGSKSPAHLNNSMNSGSAGVKRKRSGSSGGGQQNAAPNSHTNTLLAGTALQSSSVNCTLSTFTAVPNSGTSLTAIAIPSVNLSSSNLSQLNATLSDGKNPKGQAALLKDFNVVVRNIDPSSFVNSQYVITPPIIDEKTLLQGGKTGQSPKIVGSLEALQKNHIIPANAVLVDSAMQPRTTVLTPVSVGIAKPNAVVSLTNSSNQQAQVSPSPVQNTLFRTGSACSQVTSQVPNGVIGAQTDKLGGSRPALIHHKPKVNLAPTSQNPQGLLATSQVVVSSNASQVFTHLTQLHVKQSNLGLQKASGGSKLTMQPVSITLPISHLGSVGGQQQPTTHALLISSTEDTPHNDLQRMSSSPSSLMS